MAGQRARSNQSGGGSAAAAVNARDVASLKRARVFPNEIRHLVALKLRRFLLV